MVQCASGILDADFEDISLETSGQPVLLEFHHVFDQYTLSKFSCSPQDMLIAQVNIISTSALALFGHEAHGTIPKRGRHCCLTSRLQNH